MKECIHPTLKANIPTHHLHPTVVLLLHPIMALHVEVPHTADPWVGMAV